MESRRHTRSLRRPASDRTNVAARAGAPMFEPLEKREMMADSSVIAGSKVKSRNIVDDNVSRTILTVPFTGNLASIDTTKMRLFGYALNTLSNSLTAQIKVTVNVVSAQVLAADADGNGTIDHSLLEITTDRLMRKGGQIWFYPGAYTDDAGNTNVEHRTFAVKGQTKERFTMASRAFIPTNFNRFTDDVFASSGSPSANSTDVPEATVTTNLDIFLQKKVTGGLITQAQKDAAMTTYNSAAAKARIPVANLRAALLSLTGTFADAAITSFLGPNYTIVTFLDPQDSTVEVAKTTARTDGKLRTIFRPEFDGEPFQALSVWLAHEALHQDNDFKLQEEVIAVTIGTYVNAQQAQTDPAYLKAGSRLVNKENEKLLAFLNSGRTIFPFPGVKVAPMLKKAQGVFIGGKATTDGGGVYASYEDFIRRLYIARGSVSGNTAGNAVLNDYYLKLTGKTPAANMQFSDTIMTDIDALNLVIGPREAVRVANALRLAMS
ncbi:MAG: hypothetical protein QOF78_2864 [Phycisphaerales bacterium]|nr:hypothetical protein [Phycisphaerales bacterium]